MSAPIDDGGPAFARPSGPPQKDINTAAHTGMSLRDYATIEFAKALITTLPEAHDNRDPDIMEKTIRAAQTFADAMIAARKERP